jgi:hypothetical protein
VSTADQNPDLQLDALRYHFDLDRMRQTGRQQASAQRL